MAASAPGLLDVFDSAGATRPPATSVINDAAAQLVLWALVAGGVYAALSWGAARLAPSVGERRLSLASGGLVAVVGVVGALIGLAAVGNPVDRAQDQWDAFRNLNVTTTAESRSRFTSGGGNRYDYWRVAWNQFRDAPVKKGEGAGNFGRTWFAQRRVKEDVRQAHSIELQTLGELGIVGGLGLLAFVGAIVAGFAVRARRARSSPRDLGLAVAGGGMFFVWLVHTSVDWLHLLPGVTGIALCGAAVLVAPWRSADGATGRSPARIAAVAACAVIVLVGAVLIGRTALADRDLGQAREALDSSPRTALAKTTDSLELNRDHLGTYYVRAAAFARLDDYPAARATLLAATEREPHDFVTWGLLGDLAVRRGDLPAAKRAYTRASQLNPRDVALRRVARNPRLVSGD